MAVAPSSARRCTIPRLTEGGESAGRSAPLLVGRDRGVGILRAYLAGHGGLVLIGGEAGIGKTTLADALCREVTERGALVLIGRCCDLTETPPYGPWVEPFGRYRGEDGAASLPTAFAERGTLGTVVSQAMLFRQVQEFFAALAARRPALLLPLDDLHWADPVSLDLLRSVARASADLALLIIATYRAAELTRHHPLYQLLPTLVRESSAARLDLHPLEASELRTLIAQRYQLSEGDNAALEAYLIGRSEGNPFFTTELLRALEEERTLTRTDTGWQLSPLMSARLPPLLRQMIDGRLARLGEDAIHLLR